MQAGVALENQERDWTGSLANWGLKPYLMLIPNTLGHIALRRQNIPVSYKWRN